MVLGIHDQHDEGREEQRAGEAGGAKASSSLALEGAGVDAQHDEDDVDGGGDVEDLEEEVPDADEAVLLVVVEGVRVEEVYVAGAKDDGVQRLRDQGNACEKKDRKDQSLGFWGGA